MNTQSTVTTTRTKSICQDEAAIIRLGRLANAIAFAKYAYKGNYNKETVCTRRRQVYHAMYLLGGYLFEAMRLADELSERYGERPFFSDLLVFRSATARYREIFTEFVFSPGFHLESTAKATEKALERQELDLTSLRASSTSAAADGTYYHSVFAFDTQRLAEALEASFTLDQLYAFSLTEMPEIADHYLAGTAQFVEGMTQYLSMKRGRSQRR